MDLHIRALLRDPHAAPDRIATVLIRAHGPRTGLELASQLRAEVTAAPRGRARAAFRARGGCPLCGGTGTFIAPGGLDPRRRRCPRETGRLCTPTTRRATGFDPMHPEAPEHQLDLTPQERARIEQLDAVISHIRLVITGP